MNVALSFFPLFQRIAPTQGGPSRETWSDVRHVSLDRRPLTNPHELKALSPDDAPNFQVADAHCKTERQDYALRRSERRVKMTINSCSCPNCVGVFRDMQHGFKFMYLFPKIPRVSTSARIVNAVITVSVARSSSDQSTPANPLSHS
jgi:hypothetical protein